MWTRHAGGEVVAYMYTPGTKQVKHVRLRIVHVAQVRRDIIKDNDFTFTPYKTACPESAESSDRGRCWFYAGHSKWCRSSCAWACGFGISMCIVRSIAVISDNLVILPTEFFPQWGIFNVV